MKTGICQLCLETKPLIKNAHVLTEFLYDDLYNDKHKMTAFKFSKGQLKRNDNVQKGTRDDSLFCQKCDRFLGDQYENYARKFSIKGLKKGYEPKVKSYDWGVEIFNVDFQKYYRFLLLQLWRMSLSKLEGYSAIDLWKIIMKQSEGI